MTQKQYTNKCLLTIMVLCAYLRENKVLYPELCRLEGDTAGQDCILANKGLFLKRANEMIEEGLMVRNGPDEGQRYTDNTFTITRMGKSYLSEASYIYKRMKEICKQIAA